METLVVIKKMLEAIPKLGKGPNVGLTDKMWITPEGNVISLSSFHHQYFANPDISAKYDVPYTNEQETRLAALAAGFIRLNYERRQGRLTIESGTRGWNRHAKDVIFMLVADNLSSIDNISISVLDPVGKVLRNGYSQLFTYPDREKLEHLPLISESMDGKALILAYSHLS